MPCSRQEFWFHAKIAETLIEQASFGSSKTGNCAFSLLIGHDPSTIKESMGRNCHWIDALQKAQMVERKIPGVFRNPTLAPL
jgi:hypothetical protein